MFVKLLPFSAGIPLAAAFIVGYLNTVSDKTKSDTNGSSRSKSYSTLQANADAQAATQVPTRSMKSRQTDYSMASRFQSSGTVTVGGQVRAPGSFRIVSGTTLWQAIQGTGGATEFGSMRRVKLIRDGTMKVYDLTKSQWMGIVLKANDTIEVPEKSLWGS